MRLAMQRNCNPGNLKRGPGGTVDIEFAVQMLQLTHCRDRPEVLQPGTLKAIESLKHADVLSDSDADFFRSRYQFLRSVESGLRLMNTTARHDLPDDPVQLERLAFLLKKPSGEALATAVRSAREQVRAKAEEMFLV
jgi:glutamate-ammonia-ligase adenylyltransferase